MTGVQTCALPICTELPAPEVTVRSGSNKGTDVFRTPHVLVAKGFTSTAFADFDVSFQDAVRGISGRKEDRDLLIFLAAYLRSALATFPLKIPKAGTGRFGRVEPTVPWRRGRRGKRKQKLIRNRFGVGVEGRER